MQMIATCLLLFSIIAGSQARLFRSSKRETKNERNKLEISLKDLAEAENPINLRGICDVNYVKVGCFKDDPKHSRALSQELFQDRSKSNEPNYSGQDVAWGDYSTYLKGLACRCAKSSKQNGFTYFGLQDYGRCFSDPHAATSYNKYGGSKRCKNGHYQKCDDNALGECVASKRDENYVYQITEESSGNGEIDYGNAYDEVDLEDLNNFKRFN